MEIDITYLINEELSNYSASVMELGQNAGQITWDNAKGSNHVFVSTEEDKKGARDYIEEFGAWSKEEIAAWSDVELNALILQLIAGDLREYLDFASRSIREFRAYKRQCGGNIFKSGKKFYYYLGI